MAALPPHGPHYGLLQERETHGSLDSSTVADERFTGYTPRTRSFYRRISMATLCTTLLSTAALVLSFMAVSGAFHVARTKQPPSSRISLGTCGRSWQEAEKMGCVYDVMMTAWMKPECYDAELSLAYFHQSNLTFFYDPEATKPIPHEELFKGRYKEYWVHGSYHYRHCSYIWAKQMKNMGRSPVILDSTTRNWHHTIHCASMLASPNTTYIDATASSHAKLGTNSHDCIIGDWTSFESIPMEIQEEALHAWKPE